MTKEPATIEMLESILRGDIPVGKAGEADRLTNPAQFISAAGPGPQLLCGVLAIIGEDGKLVIGDPNNPTAARIEYLPDALEVISAKGVRTVFRYGNEGGTFATREWAEKKFQELALQLFSVGSVYISSANKSPSGVIGGTWESLKGFFPYFDTVSGSGGQSRHTLTVSEMPKHHHRIATLANQIFSYATPFTHQGRAFGGTEKHEDSSIVYVDTSSASGVQLVEDAGGNSAFDLMPPYQKFYAWRRIL